VIKAQLGDYTVLFDNKKGGGTYSRYGCDVQCEYREAVTFSTKNRKLGTAPKNRA